MRDPLKDPRPGDVVRLIDGTLAEADWFNGDYVGVWLREKWQVRITLEGWSKDCEDAEVIHVAA